MISNFVYHYIGTEQNMKRYNSVTVPPTPSSNWGSGFHAVCMSTQPDQSGHEAGAQALVNKPQQRRRRVQLSASQRRSLIELQRCSGQSVRTFCQARDLREGTFYAWQVRLREQLGCESTASHDFVRLVPAQVTAATGDLIEAHFPGGATLRCSSDHLSRLVCLLQGNSRPGA